MQKQNLLGMWNLCCFTGYDHENEPLIISSAKRSVKRTRKYLNRKRGLKDCIPLRKEQDYSIMHNELSRKRQFIMNELVETERRYVERLATLHGEFMQPLVKLESNCTPLKKLNIQIGLLKTFHTEFLEDLISAKSLPSVFNAKGDFLKLTQDYVNLHPEVSGIIETLKQQSKEFNKSIESNELVHQVQLIALLIEPVQRVPRYQLLLEDLLANTTETHPEFEDLENALKKIEMIVRTLNESRRSSTNTSTMYSIYQRIRGRGSSLWSPSRKYIRQNVFWRVFQGKQFKNLPPLRVRAFLFSDCIVICEDQKIGRSYKFQDEINLTRITSLEYVFNPHMSFERHKMTTDLHGVEISADGMRTLELYHTNQAVVKLWHGLIVKHKRENTSIEKKRESFMENRTSSQLDADLLYGTSTASNVGDSTCNYEVNTKYGSVSNYGSTSTSTGKNSLTSEGSLGKNRFTPAESVKTVIDHGRHRGYSISSNESDNQYVSKTTSSVENVSKLDKRRSGDFIKERSSFNGSYEPSTSCELLL